MPHTISCRLSLAAALLASLAPPARAQKPDSTLVRPTEVMVLIKNDPDGILNNTYVAREVSTKCGLADYGYPHRTHSFAVLFPDGTNMIPVTSVNFDTDSLLSGGSTASFYLSVGIRVGQTGAPPAYVIRANEPPRGEPGVARLTRLADGSDSLHVTGLATKGRKVDVEMWLVCRP